MHAPSLVQRNLSADKLKGVLDQSTVTDDWLREQSTDNGQVTQEDNVKPPLENLINAHDFEQVASKTLGKKAWAFLYSAATDLITKEANKSCFDRIWFRPRVMRNVRKVDTATTILGVKTTMPLFVSPAAMAKLIHPDGECAIARACQNKGIMQGVRAKAVYLPADLADFTGLGVQQLLLFHRGARPGRTAEQLLLPALRQP